MQLLTCHVLSASSLFRSSPHSPHIFFFLMIRRPPRSTLFPFFFNDPSTTEIYTLSLHDALPICVSSARRRAQPTACGMVSMVRRMKSTSVLSIHGPAMANTSTAEMSLRSEEHTSELQSQSNLVCRLLLEKKKIKIKKDIMRCSRR